MVGRAQALPACGLTLSCWLMAACGGQEAAPSRPDEAAARVGHSAPVTEGARSGPAAGWPSPPGDDPTEAATRDLAATAAIRLDSHLFVERDVAILTRRAGIVGKVRAERGDRVREDQILCELENENLRLAHEIARIEADKARAAFDRARRLDAEGVLSRESVENAEFALRSAEREVDMAAYELEKSFVRAPFAGIVSARNVEVGQVLAEEDTRELFRVTASGPLLARIYLPQWAYTHLRKGASAVIRPSGAVAEAVEGRVSWINDVLDAASGSAEILIEIPDVSASVLRPGMAVTVALEVRMPPGRLTVSRRAVRLSPGTPFEGEVTLRTTAGREIRRVQLGFLGDERAEVLAGLAAGDQVLVGGGGAAERRGGPSAGP